MSTIRYDHDTLHAAVVLLLDPRRGEQREKKVLERIKDLPRRPLKFQRYLEPLNELTYIAMQDPLAALKLIDLARRRRARLVEETAKLTPELEALRAARRRRADEHRARLNLALRIEELLYDRKYTGDARMARKLEISKKWADERSEYRKSRGVPTAQAHAEFTKELNARLAKELAYAEANPGIRAMSSSSQRALDQAKSKADDVQTKLNKHFRGRK